MVKNHLNEDCPYMYSEEMIRYANPTRKKMIARLEELGIENVKEKNS